VCGPGSPEQLDVLSFSGGKCRWSGGPEPGKSQHKTWTVPAVISKNSIYFMIYLNFISFGFLFLADCIASSGGIRSMKLKLISGIPSASKAKINTKLTDRQSNILDTLDWTL